MSKKVNWDDHVELQVLKEKLSERFTDPELLGGSGYGKVFKLTDRYKGRDCALKVLDLRRLRNMEQKEIEDVIKRFINEAQTYEKIAHSNIVKMYEINGDKTLPYILMEFIDGNNVDELLKKNGAFGLKEILRISKDILPAVGYIHDMGLVHRDLKSSNIIVERRNRGRCVIIDFGLVKNSFLSSFTSSDITLGSPSYIAPEAWRNARAATLKADIYSYGVMLYAMVTGEVPFNGNMVTVMNSHLFEPVPQVNDKNPNAPKGIQEIIEKSMAKDPEARYENVRVLLNALKELAEANE